MGTSMSSFLIYFFNHHKWSIWNTFFSAMASFFSEPFCCSFSTYCLCRVSDTLLALTVFENLWCFCSLLCFNSCYLAFSLCLPELWQNSAVVITRTVVCGNVWIWLFSHLHQIKLRTTLKSVNSGLFKGQKSYKPWICQSISVTSRSRNPTSVRLPTQGCGRTSVSNKDIMIHKISA